MKLNVSFGLECGNVIKTPQHEYFWHENNPNDEIEQARYESFINFNKPGTRLWCDKHDEMHRIKRISIYVAEFDTGILS